MIRFLNLAKTCYILSLVRSATGISVSSIGKNNKLVLHVKYSVSAKRGPLYVTPGDCLNANLAENRMLTEQPALLFSAQQKLIMIVSALSYFIHKTQQDKS